MATKAQELKFLTPPPQYTTAQNRNICPHDAMQNEPFEWNTTILA